MLEGDMFEDEVIGGDTFGVVESRRVIHFLPSSSLRAILLIITMGV